MTLSSSVPWNNRTGAENRPACCAGLLKRLNPEVSCCWNKPGSEALSLARQARQQRLEIKLLMADLSAGRRPLDEIVTMLAEEDRAFHLALVFAQVASLSTDQALRVLMQRDASGIAVACRALGVSTDAFGAVLKLRGRRMVFAKTATEDDLKAYAALDLATAERTMRFLKLKTKLS